MPATSGMKAAYKKDGKVGESRGQEISTAAFYNSPWDYVIRWTGK